MQRLVARFADEFNTVGGTPSEVRDRFDGSGTGSTRPAVTRGRSPPPS